MLGKLLMWLVRLLWWGIIFACLITFLPGLPPHVEWDKFVPKEPPVLEGALAVNSALNGAERLLEGELKSPESAAVKGQYIYTGVEGGKILRLDQQGKVKVITQLGPACDDVKAGEVCSSPLGMRFGHGGNLLVADANQGVFSINVDTGATTLLINSSKTIAGRLPKFVDDVVEAKSGTIFWTDASTSCSLEEGVIEILGTSSGRLLRFHPKAKKSEVLVDKIKFANGVALSPDEDFLLVVETAKSRVLRHWLEGPRAGQTEVFGPHTLPGYPDNIRESSLGGYYVSLVAVKDRSSLNLLNKAAGYKYIRKFIIRFLTLVRKATGFIDTVFHNQLSYFIYRNILSTATASVLTPPRVIVIHLDQYGEVTHSLHATDGSVRSVSQVTEHWGFLYLSSPYNQYLARVKVPPEYRKT